MIDALDLKMVELKQRCLRCWAKEFSDFFPQILNKKIAQKELKRHGYPLCNCKCLIASRRNDGST